MREIGGLERDEKGDSMLERRLNCLESVYWDEREKVWGGQARYWSGRRWMKS